jgi:sigma-B regulation protein RsbU (phosphoserine phosphatase)
MVNFGTKFPLEGIRAHRSLLDIKDECQIMAGVIDENYNDFEIVSPIKHNKEILAYLLIGGIEQDKDKLAIEVDLPFVKTYTNLLIVAIENKRLAREFIHQEAMKKEMEIARKVQEHLFPEFLPQVGPIQIEARYLPHQTVGGDYYDFIDHGENFFLCLADVSGKGVPAALLMSNFQAGLKTLIRQTEDLTEIIKGLNHLLLENGRGDLFVTFFILHYNLESKLLTYINAGHNPGMLWNGEEVIELKKGSTVLGIFEPLPFIESETIKIDKFKIILFSDGVSEVENEIGVQFGEDEIKSILIKNSENSVINVCDEVMNAVDKFRGSKSYNDDLTLLVCDKNDFPL